MTYIYNNADEVQYNHPGYTHALSRHDLEQLDGEEQTEVMRIWFSEHYEDPAASTPYESAEGGYIYIWGGPYQADDILFGQFAGVVPDEIIEHLASELTEESFEWTRKPFADQAASDEYVSEIIRENTAFYDTWGQSMEAVYALLHVPIQGEAQQALYRMTWIQIITILETFLSDAFTNTVLSDHSLLRHYIETTPYFKEQKIALQDIFTKIEQVGKIAQEHLGSIIWHKLSLVKGMYADTLQIHFQESKSDIFRAIQVRHDLVHRNGRTKDGKTIYLKKDEVIQLYHITCEFVADLDTQLVERKK